MTREIKNIALKIATQVQTPVTGGSPMCPRHLSLCDRDNQLVQKARRETKEQKRN